MAGLIGMWIVITLLVFICAVLALDDSTARFDDRERRIVGAVGLTAPLWPITAALALLAGIFFAGRYLLRVARGAE